MSEDYSYRGAPRARGQQMLAAVLMIGALGMASPLKAANINFDFNVDVQISNGVVLFHREELDVAPAPFETRREYEFNRDGAQPLTTTAAVTLVGRSDWNEVGNKSLGVRANLDGTVSAYNTNNPPPLRAGTITGKVKAHVDAVVTIDAPGAAAGAAVSFNLLNPSIHGTLSSPTSDINGTGGASISGLFVMFEYSEDFFGNRILGASKAKVFEEIAETGSLRPEIEFFQGGPMTLTPVLPPGAPPPVNANPDFTVINGAQYLVVLELTALATLQPKPDTITGAESPNISSAANFISTVHWGGFGNFADANGAPLANVRLLDESGIDWVTASAGYPVPLPPAAGLFLAGLSCLFARRRMSAA